jgi:molybdopterin biosynthesis enzyme
LSRHIKGRPDVTRFVPSFCTWSADGPEVGPVPSQGSGDLVSFARSNCFTVVPEGIERLETGATVRILLRTS